MIESEIMGDRHPKSAAYHEAGHVRIAIQKGMSLKKLGMCVLDSHGWGYSDIVLYPHHSLPNTKPTCEDSIVVLYAGWAAEQRFFPNPLSRSREADLCRIDELKSSLSPGVHLADLETQSCKLVKRYELEIELLAERLLSKSCHDVKGCEEVCELKELSGLTSSRRLCAEEIKKLFPSATIERVSIQLAD